MSSGSVMLGFSPGEPAGHLQTGLGQVKEMTGSSSCLGSCTWWREAFSGASPQPGGAARTVLRLLAYLPASNPPPPGGGEVLEGSRGPVGVFEKPGSKALSLHDGAGRLSFSLGPCFISGFRYYFGEIIARGGSEEAATLYRLAQKGEFILGGY